MITIKLSAKKLRWNSHGFFICVNSSIMPITAGYWMYLSSIQERRVTDWQGSGGHYREVFLAELLRQVADGRASWSGGAEGVDWQEATERSSSSGQHRRGTLHHHPQLVPRHVLRRRAVPGCRTCDLAQCAHRQHCLQGFDAVVCVGWVAGRASGLYKTEWWSAGVVICLERGADLHMAQLMPLPLTVSCSRKIQIGFTFLVPAHLGSPGKRVIKRVCVCVPG